METEVKLEAKKWKEEANDYIYFKQQEKKISIKQMSNQAKIEKRCVRFAALILFFQIIPKQISNP